MSQKENFVFLSSWSDVLKGYDAAGKPEIAGELAKQMIYYGVFGEITTDDPVISNTVTGMCGVIIEKSKKRYNACVANGKRGGRPKEFSEQQIYDLQKQGLSNQEIANKLGCSIKTVQRALGAESIEDDDEI